jgi:polyphosphate kinase 2 (PPK2 family)
VIALPALTEREKSQMYMQRYIPYPPAAGVVVFDRSWYNRAGVERRDGLRDEDQVETFCASPLLERAIVGSNVLLIKYWLEVSEPEQTRRCLQQRIQDGRKTWKLTDRPEVPQPLVRLLRAHATRCLPPPIPISRRGMW